MSAELNWQQNQRNIFLKDMEDNWSTRFNFLDSEIFLNIQTKILESEYEVFLIANNAFGKLDKALQICEFLESLQHQTPPQDTEKIIITILVSCAEAVQRMNMSKCTNCEELVHSFFDSVKSKLKYKIKAYCAGSNNPNFDIISSAIETLYLIRNDYIHNANFVGRFFRRPEKEDYAFNLGTFFYSEKNNKSKLIEARSKCSLSYEQFKMIFLEAFFINVERFLLGKDYPK